MICAVPFDRSLVEGTHYIGFWNTDADDYRQILDNLRKSSKQIWLQQVVANAQSFAVRYTGETARMLYWQKALTEYKQLFPDMDEYIRGLPQ